jgi:hypothetical protein
MADSAAAKCVEHCAERVSMLSENRRRSGMGSKARDEVQTRGQERSDRTYRVSEGRLHKG